MSLCVIPARGGSKRIPGKNIKEFSGKPMIAWSIEAAIQTGIFKNIVVLTHSFVYFYIFHIKIYPNI